jgi:hypothetical protein
MVPGGGVEPPRAEARRIFIPSMAFAAQTWSSFEGSRQVCGFLSPLGMWGLHGVFRPCWRVVYSIYLWLQQHPCRSPLT